MAHENFHRNNQNAKNKIQRDNNGIAFQAGRDIFVESLTFKTSKHPKKALLEEIKLEIKRRESRATRDAIEGLDVVESEIIPVRWLPGNNEIKTRGNINLNNKSIEATSTSAPLFVSSIRSDLTHQRVVLLGEPGMGKSSFLTLISKSLQAQPQKSENEDPPIPVSVGLGSAKFLPKEAKLPAEEEMISALARTVRSELPENAAKNLTNESFEVLLEEGEIILLLDGLEDLPEGYRKKLLYFLNLNQDINFILTSQPSRYWDTPSSREIKNTLLLTAQKPTESDRIRYIKDAIVPHHEDHEKWDRFSENIQTRKEHPASQFLNTPMRLWLLRQKYQTPSSDPNELFNKEEFSTEKSVSDHLNKGLVRARMASWKPEKSDIRPWHTSPKFPYSEKEVLRYLGFLGATSREQGNSEIKLWKLYGSETFTRENARTVLAATLSLLFWSYPTFLLIIEQFSHPHTEFRAFQYTLYIFATFLLIRFLISPEREPRSSKLFLRKNFSGFKPTWPRAIYLLFALSPAVTILNNQRYSPPPQPTSTEPPINEYMMWTISLTALTLLIYDVMTNKMETGKATNPQASMKEDFRSSYSTSMVASAVFSTGVFATTTTWLVFVISLPEFPNKSLLEPSSEIGRDVYRFIVDGIVINTIFSFAMVFLFIMTIEAFRSSWFSARSHMLYLGVRGLLPFRIFKFFKFMISINLIRPLGSTYRFRHSELANYLADQHEEKSKKN
ncbi:NACHT domain-containing protein [Nocardiopsis alba]|uniref:NACHT domain-containing protein n=1 Tax=Nocardiopsis alba TaxID=53437 RepID=UPI00366F0D6C